MYRFAESILSCSLISITHHRGCVKRSVYQKSVRCIDPLFGKWNRVRSIDPFQICTVSAHGILEIGCIACKSCTADSIEFEDEVAACNSTLVASSALYSAPSGTRIKPPSPQSLFPSAALISDCFINIVIHHLICWVMGLCFIEYKCIRK